MMTAFINEIKHHIEGMMANDEVFRAKVEAKKRDYSGCANYIIAEIKKRYKGKDTVCDDDEVFGLAVHYFDENIQSPGVVPGRVVVSRRLSAEEKAQVEKEAREELRREALEAEKQRLAKVEAARKKKAADKAAQKQKEWDEADLLFKFDE